MKIDSDQSGGRAPMEPYAPRGVGMITFMAKCQHSGNRVSTGIQLAGDQWNRAPFFTAYTRCSDCGEIHNWTAENVLVVISQARKKGSAVKASNVMTTTPITTSPEASISDAAATMIENRVSGLPVLDDNENLVGIITQCDLLRRAEIGTEPETAWRDSLFGPSAAARTYVHAHGPQVKHVMTRKVHTIAEDTALDRLVGLMEDKKIEHIPVLRTGKLVGIVTRSDLLKALIKQCRTLQQVQTDDNAIRDRIISEIGAQGWTAGVHVDIGVHEGVVSLCGTIVDMEQREALKVLAATVQGVTSVEDHLTSQFSARPPAA